MPGADVDLAERVATLEGQVKLLADHIRFLRWVCGPVIEGHHKHVRQSSENRMTVRVEVPDPLLKYPPQTEFIGPRGAG